MVDKKTEKLEKYIFRRMGESGSVGLSIAIIKEDKIRYSKGFGFRDFIQGISASPETIYCVGSVTKSFTALAVMQLCEEKLLNIEDPVDLYLPFNTKPMGEKILVKHLLSHTSGIPHLGYAEATLSATADTTENWLPICSPEDLLVFMDGAEEWPLAKPGQRYGYLNEGFILLGKIIEKVSGISYPEYVKEKILKPLSMNRSTFYEDDVKNDKNVATPYIRSQSGSIVATRYPYGQMIADGGLMSNAIDLVKFLNMCLHEGTLDGVKVTSSETIRNMMKPKIHTNEETVAGAGPRYYGYGFRIKSNFLGRTLIHHSGSVFGSSAYISMIPEEKTGVAIVANGGYVVEDIGEYSTAWILGEDPTLIPYFKREQTLNELTGIYKTFRNLSNYKVVRSGGILQLQSSFGQRTFSTPLIPVNLDDEIKQFNVYGIDTTTTVYFIHRDEENYMMYESNLAKKVGSL